MAVHDKVFVENPEVFAYLKTENNKIALEVDDDKIDKRNLMIIISKLITEYLSKGD